MSRIRIGHDRYYHLGRANADEIRALAQVPSTYEVWRAARPEERESGIGEVQVIGTIDLLPDDAFSCRMPATGN